MDLAVRDIPVGCRFKIVAAVEGSAEGSLLCCGLSPVQHFTIIGAPNLEVGKYTFYDLERANQDSSVFCFGPSTEALIHFPKGQFQKMVIFDLCSGMGGFSLGSQPLGIETLAFVEKNPMACDALRANFHCPVLQGDLADLAVLKQAHRLKKDHYLQITGGFPCQGYSRQGDGLGFDDPRSHCLQNILDYAWYLQADSILLECVANVTQFGVTMNHIDRFAELAHLHCLKMTFDLQQQWPMRRHRFWCHMFSKVIPAMPIPRWPATSEYTSLGHVMPFDAIWSWEDEQQLAWDEAEMTIYFDKLYGDDQWLLTPDGKAPTALHSWGNVTRQCPCGCRMAFCEARLRQGGARGFGLISALTGKCRHLHPAEGALLCTVPAGFCFPMPPVQPWHCLARLQPLCKCYGFNPISWHASNSIFGDAPRLTLSPFCKSSRSTCLARRCQIGSRPGCTNHDFYSSRLKGLTTSWK